MKIISHTALLNRIESLGYIDEWTETKHQMALFHGEGIEEIRISAKGPHIANIGTETYGSESCLYVCFTKDVPAAYAQEVLDACIDAAYESNVNTDWCLGSPNFEVTVDYFKSLRWWGG
tara:strand:+ start:1023 stop:1379 length:357 start_codon:yes stop_codon:yes gene_type:complete